MRRSVLLLFGIACAGCVETETTGLSDAILACEFGRANRLPLGGILRGSAGRATFCLEAPEGASFAVVPFIAAAPDTAARVTVRVFGAGLSAAPTVLDVQRPVAGLSARSEVERITLANDRFHESLRRREDAELRSLLRGRAPRAPRSAETPALTPALRVPVPGDVFELNVAATCEQQDLRTARVVAVTDHAIVAADPANPAADPFTTDELRAFGREFDELVYPTITQNFGGYTDLDQNGRVILYFTRAVNEIAPPGGSASVAIGFFYRGDVFPRAGIPGRTAPCPGSNEGEVLYLAVPDPGGEVRGVPVSHNTLHQVMSGTIGHELQHLINSSRRLHIVNAPALEETWLNEALSHIAEELLFYAATGLSPRQNVDTIAIYADRGRRGDAFNRYMFNNLGRFDRFIQSPHDWSPMGADGHETRGATWSFLRYAADRDPRDDAALFRSLTDGPAVGLDNLRAALGQDPLAWMEDWSVSVLADDLPPASDARYQQPSWNLRNLISALRIVDRRYPLRVLPVEEGDGFSVQLRTGSAAYPVFAVKPGERAMITLEADGAGSSALRTTLLRIR